MGGLFDGGTKQVQQQATQTALPQAEVNRLASITGQQTQAQFLKKRQPVKTVLGAPMQPIGNTSPSTFGAF